MSKYKSFRLILPEELYERWLRFYGGHGVRQTMLRKVVHIMVHRAEIRHGFQPKRPYWITPAMEEDPLDNVIAGLFDEPNSEEKEV